MNKKIAVVTGPCGGIGSAITAQLISDGLHVIGLDIKQSQLDEMSEKYGDDFTPIAIDLSDAKAITPANEPALKEALEAFGKAFQA